MTIALSIACAVLLALLLRERRVARRRYGALICEHRQALARQHIDSFRLGMMDERERWQKKQPTTNAVVERMTL